MYRALVVCNSRFPDDPGSLAELHGPKADGILMRDALSHHATGMFDKKDIRVLHESDSKEAERAIDDFFGAAEADDTLLLYYSGHGRTRNQQLFLCTRDTLATRLHSTAIPDTTLNGIISGSFAQTKILILDCCFSGLFKGNEVAEGLSGSGRYVIAATSATDRASDSKLRGMPSPFTSLLAAGLLSAADDRDGDGLVDLDDLFSYLINAPFEGPRPQRKFDGSGAVPLARRPRINPPDPHSPPTVGDFLADGKHNAPISDSTPKTGSEYLENIALDALFSPKRVSEFRERMRDDIVESMPDMETPTEFLRWAGLIRQESLTYNGLLLFGDNPTAVLPNAIVQCARFYGTSKSAPVESVEFQGTVPELIERARDYVANLARVGEAPTAESAYSGAFYVYPMIAVREIIANAVVHRDYEEHSSCVQIHLYADRIEIISPGGWGGAPVNAKGDVELGQLERQSYRRNFRLARTLTWSKLVEGVGAGVPRALADCRAVGAMALL